MLISRRYLFYGTGEVNARRLRNRGSECNCVCIRLRIHFTLCTSTRSATQTSLPLKVHKTENLFDSDFGICIISLLVMHK
jgi:hypothetical protein